MDINFNQNTSSSLNSNSNIVDRKEDRIIAQDLLIV